MKYRLQQFDLTVQKATDVIGFFDRYHYDTTSLKTTLAEIIAKRSTLESAVSSKDKDALKVVYLEPITLG
ncbi:MAG: hypothetical protein WCJ93_04575 [Methanomicrobiales archaeon]